MNILSEVIILTGAICTPNITGYYMESIRIEIPKPKPIITFCKGYENNEYILIHELSHHIYFTKLTPKQRELWIKLSKLSKPTDYVSEYAKTNESEDFAETLTHFHKFPIIFGNESPVMKMKKMIAKYFIIKYLK